MYVKAKGIKVLVICLYVYDLIYTTNRVVLTEDFKRLIINKFEITNLGLMSYFLGLEVKQNGTGIFLSQEKYRNDLRGRFQMQNFNLVKTPLNTN